MNNTETAKKHKIIEYEYEFFSEECLKFLSENDKEIILNDTIGLYNLQFSGYEHDEGETNYVKTGNTINYEFEGEKYELLDYKNCFTYYTYLCNEKTKKFRNILISDYADFDGEGVYIYKGKYFCQYYETLKALLFFNRNQYILNPGPAIMHDIRKAKSTEFIAKYFNLKGTLLHIKKNAMDFWEANDESVLVEFGGIYIETMKEYLALVDANFLSSLDGTIELYSLIGSEYFRDFCNELCEPETFKKELMKNGEIRKNLKNNHWLFHEYENTLRDIEDEYVEGEDYTFLILNAIKALEYLLYKKIKNYADFKMIENDENVSEKVMLGEIIAYIEKKRSMFRDVSESMIPREKIEIICNEYVELLYYVKDECRNGYFHKHRLDKYADLCKKRKKVLEAITKTVILLK